MFANLDPIVVMFLAWLVVVLCFFVLAIQLFITLIEFKLTTLAGFVLVPFALWNKTSFLAEKVLGNVVAAGIKVLVLAVIVGIGSGLFAQFQVHPAEPNIDHALVIMLASLTLLALGIFGPGIATGLVSGAPQLGAGAMAGAAVGAAGTAVAVGAAATGVGGAVAAGAHGPGCRQAGRQRRAPRRRLAARSRRSRRVPLPPAAVPKARWRAWATSPRPARSLPDALPHPALPLPGSAWPPFRAGWNGDAGASAGQAATSEAPAGAAAAERPSSPLGPSGCIAASSSPTPRPPLPTRCAVATAAAPGKARACAAPTTDAIHKEN